jgi:hypothetical protein
VKSSALLRLFEVKGKVSGLHSGKSGVWIAPGPESYKILELSLTDFIVWPI